MYTYFLRIGLQKLNFYSKKNLMGNNGYLRSSKKLYTLNWTEK